jgi:hypothetical protein
MCASNEPSIKSKVSKIDVAIEIKRALDKMPSHSHPAECLFYVHVVNCFGIKIAEDKAKHYVGIIFKRSHPAKEAVLAHCFANDVVVRVKKYVLGD